jgi:SsrA-binding protein
MASNEVNIKNKRARFEFFIEEEFTAGLKLAGTEIKSIRNGKASIIEAYCVWHEGELWIRNMYIAPTKIIFIRKGLVENQHCMCQRKKIA